MSHVDSLAAGVGFDLLGERLGDALSLADAVVNLTKSLGDDCVAGCVLGDPMSIVAKSFVEGGKLPYAPVNDVGHVGFVFREDIRLNREKEVVRQVRKLSKNRSASKDDDFVIVGDAPRCSDNML